MGISVLEVLENAKFNLGYGTQAFQKQIGLEQLNNAIEQLNDDPNADNEFIEKESQYNPKTS